MDIFEFKKSIDDMSEGELRATARDFREKHNEQVTEANETEAKLTEYKEQLEAAQEDAEAYLQFFAGKASEVKDMEADVLADRFSAAELREMVEDADEFSEPETPEPETEAEVEDEPEGTKFSERPPKAPVAEETVDFNEKRASGVLADLALIPEEN